MLETKKVLAQREQTKEGKKVQLIAPPGSVKLNKRNKRRITPGRKKKHGNETPFRCTKVAGEKDETVGKSLPSVKIALYRYLARSSVMLFPLQCILFVPSGKRPVMNGRWRPKCHEVGSDDCSSSASVASQR